MGEWNGSVARFIVAFAFGSNVRGLASSGGGSDVVLDGGALYTRERNA